MRFGLAFTSRIGIELERAPTMRLGTCVLIVPQRNPLGLAKELATLDRISGGRVELGLGVGWMKEEFDALGVPWDDVVLATTSTSRP